MQSRGTNCADSAAILSDTCPAILVTCNLTSEGVHCIRIRTRGPEPEANIEGSDHILPYIPT